MQPQAAPTAQPNREPETAGGAGGSGPVAGEVLAFDVAVAGGGVGGLALATRLARQGHKVAVVERTQAGTFRVGESLDWEAPVFLGRLGFDVSRWVEEGKATFKGGAVVGQITGARPKSAFDEMVQKLL